MLVIADALPSGKASEYVAAAYLVFLLLLVVYLTIMAIKVQRIEKDLRDLASFAEQGSPGTPAQGEEAAPGRESEPQSISVSSGASESEEAAHK